MRSRDEVRAAVAPRGYRWPLHVGLAVLLWVGLGLAALAQLWPLATSDALGLLGILVILNGGEYYLHRRPFHRPMFTRITYRRHTLEHHAFFGRDTMGVDSLADLHLVMFPWWGLLGIVAASAPLFGLAYWLGSAHATWLLLLGYVLYFSFYETFHTLSHLPEASALARLRLVRAVTLHHRLHHDPAYMTRYNFNFALPLFDLLFGTYLRRAPTPTLESGHV